MNPAVRFSASQTCESIDPSVGAERPLEVLLSEFLTRHRRGEELSVEMFAAANPVYASQIRELFPAVLFLESVAPDDAASGVLSPIPKQLGDFEIREEIGRGGMGVVYLAQDLRLNRPVALKVILAGEHAGADARQRFQSESKIVAKLRHPGIVQVYEIGEQDRRAYMALEYIEGGNLGDYLDGTPKPMRWSAAIILQLARIIHYAHENGIVHRDLKPENVMLTTAPSKDAPSNHRWDPGFAVGSGSLSVVKVKISDFGLAKNLLGESELTRTGTLMGTPTYMAPEQTTGQSDQVGPGADIHALGAILYLLITGKPPFVSREVLETLRMVEQEDAPAPGSLNPQIPRDLETVCLKCLRKRPSQRYESAADLADDLERFLKDEPVLARPLSVVERAIRWARHQPLLATMIILTTGFYSLHLFLVYVLHSPFHAGIFHAISTVYTILVVGGACSVPIFRDERWQEAVQSLLILSACLFITATAALHRGPREYLIPIFFVAIAATSLYSTRSWVAWLLTGVCVAGYSMVWCIAHWYRPDVALTLPNGIGNVVCLIAMGAVAHLAIRRAGKGVNIVW